jgi:hypothetical protein
MGGDLAAGSDQAAIAAPREEAAAAAPAPAPAAHLPPPLDTPRWTNTFLKKSINWSGRHYPYVRVCYYYNTRKGCSNAEPCRSGLHGRLDSVHIHLPHCPSHPSLHGP